MAGRSLVPTLASDAKIEREFLFFKHVGNRGIRVGDWKLVALKGGPWELYDLSKDRAEGRDLAASHPEKVKELEAIWNKHDKEFSKQGATGALLKKSE